MSEFYTHVVELGKIGDHPNADRLEITNIYSGYPCIVQKGLWKPGDRAVYISIDALVPMSNPMFSFLDSGKGREFERIKAKKLRGIFSMGILVPADPKWEVGQNVSHELGIKKYVPELNEDFNNGINIKDPGFIPVYTDICGLRKYSHIIQPGEEVMITEKLEGENARYVYYQDQLWIGSHRKIKVPGRQTRWGLVAETHGLEEKLSTHPGMILYGETYGYTRNFPYDVSEPSLRVFDVFDIRAGKYLNCDDAIAFVEKIGLSFVPVLYRGPWNINLLSLAEGKSSIGDHIKEGFIVKPVQERWDAECGRVVFKMKGEDYMLGRKRKFK